jgi:hypothetical protein
MPTYGEFMGLCGGPEEVTYNFRFQINGTSNPDNLVGGNAGGKVTDVVRISAGVFDVEFAIGYPTLLAGQVNLQDDPTMGGQIVSWTQATRKLRVQTNLQDGTSAAADPTDDKWVHVNVVFCRRDKMAPVVAI